MGGAKDLMLHREWLESAAIPVLVKAGAATRCAIHEDVFIDNGEVEALSRAYAIGTNMVKQGEMDCDRQEFMDAIKAAHGNAYRDCPYCAKNAKE